jgi:hypothetical protein
MDTATQLVFRHAHRTRALLALAVVALFATALLVFVAQSLGAANAGPMPELPLLGPFRWDGERPGLA